MSVKCGKIHALLKNKQGLKISKGKMIVFNCTSSVSGARGFPRGQHLVNAVRPDSRHLEQRSRKVKNQSYSLQT